jgi:hypothetical protein
MGVLFGDNYESLSQFCLIVPNSLACQFATGRGFYLTPAERSASLQRKSASTMGAFLHKSSGRDLLYRKGYGASPAYRAVQGPLPREAIPESRGARRVRRHIICKKRQQASDGHVAAAPGLSRLTIR